MPSVSDLVARVKGLCRPVSDVADADIEAALVATSHQLDELSPEVTSASVALTDGEADLTAVSSWADGESRVRAVEYPLNEVPRSLLAAVQWDHRDDDTLGVYEGGSDTVRVYFTIPHSVDTVRGTTSYSSKEGEAAAHFAAAEVLESMAARWTQKQAVSLAGQEYDGPYPETVTRAAEGFRKRGRDLLAGPALSIGHEPLAGLYELDAV